MRDLEALYVSVCRAYSITSLLSFSISSRVSRLWASRLLILFGSFTCSVLASSALESLKRSSEDKLLLQIFILSSEDMRVRVGTSGHVCHFRRVSVGTLDSDSIDLLATVQYRLRPLLPSSLNNHIAQRRRYLIGMKAIKRSIRGL